MLAILMLLEAYKYKPVWTYFHFSKENTCEWNCWVIYKFMFNFLINDQAFPSQVFVPFYIPPGKKHECSSLFLPILGIVSLCL